MAKHYKKVLNKAQILALYRELGSWSKVGNALGINKGVAWRIAHSRNGYSERVGNKKGMKERKIYPIWKVLPNLPDFYRIVRTIVYGSPYRDTYCPEEAIDYCLDYIYSRRALSTKRKEPIKNAEAYLVRLTHIALFSFLQLYKPHSFEGCREKRPSLEMTSKERG